MIRLAMLGPYPLDDGPLTGGVEAVMAVLAEALARTGEVELHVVTARSDVERPTVREEASITVHIVPRHRRSRLALYRRDVMALRRAIGRIRPDLVHAHGAGMVYVDAAEGARRPAVITLHGVIFREADFMSNWRHWLRWQMDILYERYCVRRARHVIAISPYIQREYHDLLRGQVYPVENPVHDRFFAEAGEPEPGLILCPARIIPRKGILTLLSALRGLAETLPEARLEIAGQTGVDPAYERRCREYIAQFGLEARVRFLGPLSPEEMVKAYARAAVVALPSLQETAPVVIAEAMAMGRPVVASNVGGVADMIEDGRTGRVVMRAFVPELANALFTLLRDPEQARRMGEAGRAEAERRFRADRVAAQTLEVYRRVMEAG